MSWRPPVLPLAPRPLPGEGVLSWVGRVAARYDLDAPGLVALLYPPGTKVHPSRVWALDWTGQAGLDEMLAAATRLHPGRIAALRLVPGDPARAAGLLRPWAAWCHHCVRDDAARYGEAYERAVWRLGWCVACLVHGCLLGQACPSCLMGECSFRAVAGRVRLVCDSCRGPVGAVPPGKERLSFGTLAAAFASRVAPELDGTVLQLQEALLAASTVGTAPSGPIGLGLDAEAFLSLARTMVAPSVWALQYRAGRATEPDQDVGTPGALSVAGLHRCISDLAALLSKAAKPAGPADATAPTPGGGKASGDFVSVLRCYFGQDREDLRRKAQAWGPVVGPMVLGVLDEQDERARRHAEAAEQARQEAVQARRDAAWARKAAKQAVADLRRIRAKRERRATLARLRRQYETRQGVSRGPCGRPGQAPGRDGSPAG